MYKSAKICPKNARKYPKMTYEPELWHRTCKNSSTVFRFQFLAAIPVFTTRLIHWPGNKNCPFTFTFFADPPLLSTPTTPRSFQNSRRSSTDSPGLTHHRTAISLAISSVSTHLVLAKIKIFLIKKVWCDLYRKIYFFGGVVTSRICLIDIRRIFIARSGYQPGCGTWNLLPKIGIQKLLSYFCMSCVITQADTSFWCNFSHFGPYFCIFDAHFVHFVARLKSSKLLTTR